MSWRLADMAKKEFLEIYRVLLDHYGEQRWWPAESAIEMIVGAVLTQNTNWKNVEKAIAVLRERNLLSFEALAKITQEELADFIRPAGYYNLKTTRLKNLLQMIADEYGGSMQQFINDDLYNSRENLLKVKGVGEETADSILLYACGHPTFVVDTYTHRVFSRHNLLAEECTYGDIQESFMDNLPSDPDLYNEYHALIVRVAKEYCRKSKPLCEQCPLNFMLL